MTRDAAPTPPCLARAARAAAAVIAAVLLGGVSGCDLAPRPFVVDVPLRLVSAEPSPGAVGVGRDVRIRLRFSEALRSPHANSFQLFDVTNESSPARVRSEITYVDTLDGEHLVTVIPASRLGLARRYRLTVDTAVQRQRDGAPLPTRLRLEFATELPPPFTVESISPGDGATGVDAASVLSVRFTEPPRCPLAGAAVFQQPDAHPQAGPAPRTVVAGTWSCTAPPAEREGPAACAPKGESPDPCRATFEAEGLPFAAGTQVTVTLAGLADRDELPAVESLRALGDAGRLPATVTATFRIADPPPLVLLSSGPADRAAGVERSARPVLVFSEPPRCGEGGALLAAALEVLEKRDGTPVDAPPVEVEGTWSCPAPLAAGETCGSAPARCAAEFQPAGSAPWFSYSSRVFVRVRGGTAGDGDGARPLESARATSRSGQLPSTRVISFDIEDPPPLTIASTQPGAGATRVAADAPIVVRVPESSGGFDCESLARHLQVEEEFDPLVAARLGAPSRVVQGQLDCADGGNTATWTGGGAEPFAFRPSSRVVVSLAGGAFGAAVQSALATGRGGQLPADGYRFAFEIDDPAPLRLLRVSPSDQATGIPGTARVQAYFNQPLDCASVVRGTNLTVEARSPQLAAGGQGGLLAPVPGSVACEPGIPGLLEFVADAAYVPSTEVLLRLGTEAALSTLRSAEATTRGGLLEAPLVSVFRVADPPPLRVLALVPSGDPALNVAPESTLRVRFDRPIVCESAFLAGRPTNPLRLAEVGGPSLEIASANCEDLGGFIGATGEVLVVTPRSGELRADALVEFGVLPGVLSADATVVAETTHGRLAQPVLTRLRIGAEPLRVLATTPVHADPHVPWGSALSLRFNQPLAANSVIPCGESGPAGCNARLSTGGVAVDLDLACEIDPEHESCARPDLLVLQPAAPLAPGEAYLFELWEEAGAPRGANGVSTLPAPFSLSFRAASQALVMSTSPAHGATGVPVSVAPCATFAAEVALASLPGEVSVTLVDRFGRTVSLPLALTPFTVGGGGRTVCVQLASGALEGIPTPRTLLYDKDVTVTFGANTTVGSTTLGAPFAFTFRTGPPPGLASVSARNAVVEVPSLAGAQDVPVRLEIRATFTFDVDSTSLAAIELKQGPSTVVAAASLVSPRVVRLVPQADLAFDTDFRLVIGGGSSGVKDLAGNYLDATTVHPFRTGIRTTVQIGPPEAQLQPDASVSLVFSRPLFLPSANSAHILGYANATVLEPVAGLIAQSALTPRTVQYLPAQQWPRGASAAAQVQVSDNVLDERGNPVLPASRTWTGVGSAAPTEPVTLVPSALSPASGSIAPDQTFTLTAQATGLANRYLPLTFNASTVRLESTSQEGACFLSGPIPLSITYNVAAGATAKDSVTFRPTSALSAQRIRSGCPYRLSVHQRSLANLFFVAAPATPEVLQWNFTGETTRPTLTAASVRVRQASGEVGIVGEPNGVLGHTTVVATFSEPIDPESVHAQTFVVAGAPAGTYRVNGNVVTFTPGGYLTGGQRYAVTVRASVPGQPGVRDLAGNALLADVTGAFTVETAPPTLAAGSPFTRHIPDGTLRLAFSEAIDPGSLVPSRVGQPGTLRIERTAGGSWQGEIFGLLSVDAADPKVVIFSPADALTSGTYTATVTTGVRDTALTPFAAQATRTLTF